MGAIMVYGSYLPADASIPRTTFTIALCDTSVAILAGLAIFPIVFAYGLEAQGGPGLVFKTLTIRVWAYAVGTVFRRFVFRAAYGSGLDIGDIATGAHRRLVDRGSAYGEAPRQRRRGVGGVVVWSGFFAVVQPLGRGQIL